VQLQFVDIKLLTGPGRRRAPATFDLIDIYTQMFGLGRYNWSLYPTIYRMQP
jgi:hypothetical protein